MGSTGPSGSEGDGWGSGGAVGDVLLRPGHEQAGGTEDGIRGGCLVGGLLGTEGRGVRGAHRLRGRADGHCSARSARLAVTRWEGEGMMGMILRERGGGAAGAVQYDSSARIVIIVPRTFLRWDKVPSCDISFNSWFRSRDPPPLPRSGVRRCDAGSAFRPRPEQGALRPKSN